MSNTTGWKRVRPGAYTKTINGVEYTIQETYWAFGKYWIVCAGSEIIHSWTTGKRLESMWAAKIAVNDHALTHGGAEP